MNLRHLAMTLGVLAALSLAGAGCFRKPLPPAVPPGEPERPQAWLPPTPNPETEEERNVRELREAIEAFANVKSFRANITIDHPGDSTTGELEVVKPNRFRGTMRLASDPKETTVIGVEDSLYVKVEDIWIPIRSPALSASLKEALRSSVSGDSVLRTERLPDGTVVQKRRNDAGGCEEYSTTITDENGASVDLTVCVANGLPSTLLVRKDGTTVTITYADFNALFTIERPTIPKEFR
ncbi:hypothetical protein HY479_01790 [Candidatus Uhrbacteria bacterium]|nr:hypothetical protein [Candidatus Uhrbacteria bacterium]